MVVAIVHPIHAPIAKTAKKAMKTGMAITHILMASKAGRNSSNV